MATQNGSTVLPMMPLPTRADDPRLDGWYHTIELAPGMSSRGFFDHRGSVDKVGLPPSLEGKTALDVGTGDGFWSFEMEQRGAQRVVAIDVACFGDLDLLPTRRARISKEFLENQAWPLRFATAHRLRQSRVEYRICNVYNLSPEAVGELFDVVYCGDLLMHLKNPLQALINIRSVTREMAVITTGAIGESLELEHPELSLLRFGHLHGENQPGDKNVYWEFSTKALCDMLIYAGFTSVEPQERFGTRITHESSQPMYTAVAAVARV